MIKIFIPPIDKFEIQSTKGEYNHILKDGIKLNSDTELVETFEEADYMFLDFRHLSKQSGYNYSNIKEEWWSKGVVVDYKDSSNLLTSKGIAYFKRSVVNKKTHTFVEYPRKVFPISYCIKNHCLEFNPKPCRDREYDIAVFFRVPSKMNKVGMYNRALVAEFITEKFSHKKIWVGIAGFDGEGGRMNTEVNEYYSTMLNAKIVVNCNPDWWEGDYRLFEALSCGCMVMSDPMITPVENPFVNEKHLVYYDTFESLFNKVNFYLDNIDKLETIAKQGYDYSMKFHKSSDRINQILSTIKN